ncbi:hypothetical protein R6Q57_015605 [Mikania cordata]
MASPVPEKFQPLHNFLPTHLNWKNHRSSRSRFAGEASSSFPPLRSHTHAPSSPHPRSNSPANASGRSSPPTKQSMIRDNNNNWKRSNEISIRFLESSKQHDASDEVNHSSSPTDHSVPVKAVDDKSSPKTWNLRPRRLPVSHKQSAGGFPTIGTSRLQENKQLPELNKNCNSDSRTTQLPTISIALSRGEIEDDVLFLTGSKPSRRSKKRPRVVQKQLDNLFPGLWLDSISADSYKVLETASKVWMGSYGAYCSL